MIFFPIDAGVHVEKRRQKTGRYLVLQSPAEWPGAGRIQVNRIDVGDENVDWAPQGYWQSFRIPRIIRHVEFLKQDLFDTRKGLGHQLVGPIDRNRRIVVVERALLQTASGGA